MNLYSKNLNTEKLWTKSFILLTLSSLLLFLNLQMLLSTFPAYVKQAFQASDLGASLVISVFAATAIVARLLTSYFIRRINRNIILCIGLAIAALNTGLNIVAPSVNTLLIMRAGYGFGFGIASVIIPTIVSQVIPSRRMGEGIGYFGLSTSLAMSVGPMIGLNIFNQYGFDSLALLGTVAVILIYPILFILRGHIAVHRDTRQAVQEEKSFKHAENSKKAMPMTLLLPALLNVILSITYSGILSFIALFGQELQLSQVGLFFLFNAMSILIIRPISGKIFDRKGPASVLIPACISIIISMLVLSFTSSMLMLIISALLYGLGFGSIQPTLQAWMLNTTPKEQHGTANSMFYNATDVGVAVGALLLGAIASATSYAVMYRYSAASMILFIIIFVAVRMIAGRRAKVAR